MSARWLRAAAIAALALASLAGCARHRPVPVVAAHYVVGAPYEAGGFWHYPRESFDYHATGLAVRVPDRPGLTADGEAFDGEAMAGAHATLQLPAIARVTDLQTGRSVRVRLNDRGPANPDRLLGLTRRAADLLGIPEGGVAQVRAEVENGSSQALRDRLNGGPKGIIAAPVAAVTAEDLPPPGGKPRAASRVAATTPEPPAASVADEVPDRLPAVAEQGPAEPGQLWLQAGRFSNRAYANVVKSELSALPVEIRREAGAQAATFSVMVGPFASVAAADAALDRARAAGVTDAVIVVE